MYFWLIAKRLGGKSELREEGYLCYDFEDMQKAEDYATPV